ncbi:hypothetical protein ACFSL6_26535 [Paenibacillus thailandensis]|uniref:Uncharacterized protein n=1 Tax=Paenibacillus thailandensis TaxID=393250 RepID=A0ABW5QRG0_9BACL
MAYDEYDDRAGGAGDGKKTYYVSVGAGQVLEDPHAAAYELVIRATEEEVSKLQELFGDLSSVEEAEAGHYGLSVFDSNEDRELNSGYDETIAQIYRLLYECGTEETKRHIASMNLF